MQTLCGELDLTEPIPDDIMEFVVKQRGLARPLSDNTRS